MPEGRVHTGRGTGCAGRTRWCGPKQTEKARVAEVGRFSSGASESVHQRGPRFRAPYSGYSLKKDFRLIPFKRVLSFARLGRCLSRKRAAHVETDTAIGRACREKAGGGHDQTRPQAKKRNVSGRPPDSGAERGWNRYRCEGNLRGGTAGPGRESGTGVFYLHRRPTGDGAVAGQLRHHHGGYGKYGGCIGFHFTKCWNNTG